MLIAFYLTHVSKLLAFQHATNTKKLLMRHFMLFFFSSLSVKSGWFSTWGDCGNCLGWFCLSQSGGSMGVQVCVCYWHLVGRIPGYC